MCLLCERVVYLCVCSLSKLCESVVGESCVCLWCERNVYVSVV